MVIVDTSAWIEYLRATGSEAHLRLRDLLTGDPAAVGTTGAVVMELLVGAAAADGERRLRALLARHPHLATRDPDDFERAAALQRACRVQGATVRTMVDCLIAAVALRVDAAVLAHDRDFEVLARHTALRLA